MHHDEFLQYRLIRLAPLKSNLPQTDLIIPLNLQAKIVERYR